MIILILAFLLSIIPSVLIIIILRAICEAVSIPVVAIGGITQNNVIELAGTGICGVAVISAIFGAKDIKKAAEDLKKVTIESLKL